MNNYYFNTLDFKKKFRIMKIVFIFIWIGTLSMWANELCSQNATIHIADNQGITIEKLIQEVESQTNYLFVYSKNEINVDEHVSLPAQEISVKSVLDNLAESAKLAYMYENDYIVLTKRELASNEALMSFQGITITGTVTDTGGDPLPGATVTITGSSQGVITDVNGVYTIQVSDANTTLLFSYVGYRSQEIIVGDQRTIHVVMEEISHEMEEVVVVGYGTQKRMTMSSAVATVKGEELTVLPTPRISTSIGGMVSGVITYQQSGAPGSDDATIYVRGSQPLVLVDGVERGGDRVNKDDIESVSILKDAAAVAPYGLRGANGVILITTKRGAAGKLSATYNGEASWQKPMRTPKLMGSADYFEFRNKAYEMDGLDGQKMSNEEIAKYRSGSDPDRYPNTDWIGNYMQTSMATKHNLSVSGGTEKIRAFASFGYVNQGSMFHGQTYSRYSFRSNVDIQATPTTKVSIDNSFTKDILGRLGMDASSIMGRLYRGAPYEVDRYSNGFSAFQSSQGISLYEYIYHSGNYKDQNDVSTTNITIDQQLPFLPGLSGKVAFNYDKQHRDNKSWSEPVVYYNLTPEGEFEKIDQAATVKPSLSQIYRRWDNYTFNGQLKYNNSFGKHFIDVLTLFEARWTEYATTETGKSEFDFLIPELNTGTTDRTKWALAGTSSQTAQYGIVARVNYNFNQRYLVELAGRYDATYRYAPGRRGAYFPSASLGWRISEEPFMEFSREIVENLKLRASYGKSGNPVGATFSYMSTYDIGSSYIWGSPGVRTQGIFTNTESNPNLTWETVRKTDVGFDLNMWKGLLGMEIDFYHEKRSDKILAPNADVPVEYGISLADENAGIDARWGMDITLHNRTKINNDFNIQNALVFSYTRHQLIENHENQGTLYNPRRRTTGLASSQIWGYKAAGLFVDEEEIRNWAYQSPGTLPGDIKYVDINGDGKIDSEDYVWIGRARIPEIMWGYHLRASWKKVELALFFQGTGRSNFATNQGDVCRPFVRDLARVEHNNSWTTDNPDPNASFPRLRSSNFAMNYVTSDFWVINSSYVKLKSIDVAYNFQPDWIKKSGMNNLRLYANFFNVWTIFSKASKDFDPEAQDYASYPQQFISTIGLTVTF